MNKIPIVDVYDASRIMAGLLMRAGYEPVITDCIVALIAPNQT